MGSRNVTGVEVTQDPQAYEDTHVHAVYDQIAPHFSSTRYKVSQIVRGHISSSNFSPAVAHNRPVSLWYTSRISGARFWYRERQVSGSSSRPTTQLVDYWIGQEPRLIGDRKACGRVYTGGSLG